MKEGMEGKWQGEGKRKETPDEGCSATIPSSPHPAGQALHGVLPVAVPQTIYPQWLRHGGCPR